MSKNVDFSETCFSQDNEVGLRMYTIYVITKNGFAWFHWEITCFTLKMELFWKSGKVRRTLWFWWFCRIWPVKRTCMHTYTHMWLMCIHSWGNWVVCLVFGSIVLVVLKLWNMRWTLQNLEFKWFDLWYVDVYTTALICDLCIYLVEVLKHICFMLMYNLENGKMIRTLSKIIFKTK